MQVTHWCIYFTIDNNNNYLITGDYYSNYFETDTFTTIVAIVSKLLKCLNLIFPDTEFRRKYLVAMENSLLVKSLPTFPEIGNLSIKCRHLVINKPLER